jgi:hypothetical protein
VSKDNIRVTVEVTSGSGKIIAFGSDAANGSQDPSTLEMAYADSLLAENSSGGSITGVTAGAGLTGGGTSGTVTLDVGAGQGISVDANTVSIANGGVTKAKLAASGGTSGQVLKVSGGGLAWAADEQGGLTLPYHTQASLDVPAFWIENNGAGRGVAASSQNQVGIVGSTLYGDAAILGWALGGSGRGVEGLSYGSAGVYGQGSTAGVEGYSFNAAPGVLGTSFSGAGVKGTTSGSGYAGLFEGRVQATASTSANVVEFKNTYGSGGRALYAESNGTTIWGYTKSTSGNSKGVAGTSEAGTGIYGGTASGYAGYFDGRVRVNGAFSATSKSFQIDHPLDPEHKYLNHVSVESPDMMNIYNGNVVTDENGSATVTLPDWFEALNRDFRYQLTVIGRFAQAIVEREIEDNAFVIRTNLANVKVSWQVTGVRKDAWAEAHRVPVEEEKPAEEQGTYLHAEEWGQPEERSLAYRRGEVLPTKIANALSSGSDSR